MSSSNLNQSNSKDPAYLNRNERFAKLSEKIAQIQNTEIQNPSNKFNKLDQKIDEVEDNLSTNIQALESKFSLLKEQLSKFTKIVEDEKASKDKLKMKNSEELKTLENKIKNMFLEEREYMKNYVDNSVKKIETQLQTFEKNCKTENETINNNLIVMKEYMDVELPNLNAKIENETEERSKIMHNIVNEMNGEFSRVHELREESESTFVTTLEEIMQKVKAEFTKERKQREEFEENIFCLLEETFTKLSTSQCQYEN